ncbi:unnamed protein product [Symbiodinium natans]|uniref:Uncharacterized protein n=1 Tax=Symbiodinium natans TaxID=878477 RepID=A0A812IEU1_9DINO|nr:unnamed protein product [Symbiodinium natans]
MILLNLRWRCVRLPASTGPNFGALLQAASRSLRHLHVQLYHRKYGFGGEELLEQLGRVESYPNLVSLLLRTPRAAGCKPEWLRGINFASLHALELTGDSGAPDIGPLIEKITCFPNLRELITNGEAASGWAPSVVMRAPRLEVLEFCGYFMNFEFIECLLLNPSLRHVFLSGAWNSDKAYKLPCFKTEHGQTRRLSSFSLGAGLQPQDSGESFMDTVARLVSTDLLTTVRKLQLNLEDPYHLHWKKLRVAPGVKTFRLWLYSWHFCGDPADFQKEHLAGCTVHVGPPSQILEWTYGVPYESDEAM